MTTNGQTKAGWPKHLLVCLSIGRMVWLIDHDRGEIIEANGVSLQAIADPVGSVVALMNLGKGRYFGLPMR